MLTSVSQAAARRVLSSRATTKLAQNALASRKLVIRPAVSYRVFTTTQRAWAAEAKTTKKSTAAATKTKKKPAAKAKKPAAKKKPKKKAAKKPKAVKKPKKVLTPEEKTRQRQRALKKLALLSSEPKVKFSAWSEFIRKNMQSGSSAVSQIAEVSRRFKALSPAELEKVQASAAATTVANKEKRTAWVRSHPPEAIFVANRARKALNRLIKGKSYPLFEDERLPKASLNPYALYIKAKAEDGAFEGATFGNNPLSSLAKNWTGMSASEKRIYVDGSEAGKSRYQTEMKELQPKIKEYLNQKAKEGVKL